MAVILNYEGYKLGTLDYNGKYYTYRSLPEETIAKEKYLVVKINNLCDSKSLKSDKLFLPFAEILDRVMSRPDLIEQAGIVDSDSDYDKLTKISKLKMAKREYHLTQE